MKRERYAFILIADEKYWNRLREHSKANRGIHAFVLKNQVGPKNAQTLLFYVKKPVMQIRGVADFVERLTSARGENTVQKAALARALLCFCVNPYKGLSV